jgi:pyruvate kinase
MISKYRPKAIIAAVTPNAATARQAQLVWGVYPVLRGESSNSDEMVTRSIRAAKASGLAKNGDMVVVTAGLPSGSSGTTNMIRVHVIADILLSGQGIGQSTATGRVCIVKTQDDIAKYQPGDILVVPGIDEHTALSGMRAAAIIAEEGGLTSNAAIVGVNYGVPVVVQAENATAILKDGMVVTVDPTRGLVYEGEIQAR